MTDRASDVEARIGTVRQLSSVIGAMRGVAAARSREARSQLDGVRAYARTIAGSIGQILAFSPELGRADPVREELGAHAIIALVAEQGFAGAFSERVLAAVRRLADASLVQRTEILLIGDRGLMVAQQRGFTIDWAAPMVAHVEQAAPLANKIVDALYARIDARRVTRVTVVHAIPDGSSAIQIVERQLLPFDFSRFPASANKATPLLTLPPTVLLARLVEEYVFAELCEATVLSFAAENEARMRAMIEARANVTKTLDGLVARSRQLRQEEITNEIIELAGGNEANANDRDIGPGPRLKSRIT